MQQITLQQYNSLVKGIYDSYMSNEDMGMGEIGDTMEESKRIVNDWMNEHGISFPEN